jgi:hypothetical protein
MCAAFRSDSAKYFCVVLSESGPDHLHVIAERSQPRGRTLLGAGYGNDEHGHGIHEHGSWLPRNLPHPTDGRRG